MKQRATAVTDSIKTAGGAGDRRLVTRSHGRPTGVCALLASLLAFGCGSSSGPGLVPSTDGGGTSSSPESGTTAESGALLDAGNTPGDASTEGSTSIPTDSGTSADSSSIAADGGSIDATSSDGATSDGAALDAGTVDGADDAAGPTLPAGPLVNGLEWADTSGDPIQAHGGGMLKVGAFYYWFGENRNPDGTFYAVSCYRSSDLRSWEFRHNVLTMNSAAELKPADIERPKVAFDAATGQYVMWMHWENGSDYGQARAAVASSSTVDGDYDYKGSFRPFAGTGVVDHGMPGYMSRDSSLFVDDDGTAYFISATNENTDLNLYKLTSDYLTIDTLVATVLAGQHREAPALFRRNNVYFLLTSAATSWTPNQAEYATSSELDHGWSGLANVGDSTTFSSQAAFVVPVQGSSGTTYLYMGDRWAGDWSGPVNDSTYVWEPMSFPSSTSMAMTWENTLTIDATAGTVTGATNSFAFVGETTGQRMQVQGASTTNGGAIVQAAQDGKADEKWTLNYDGSGYFRLTNVGSGLVLDVPSSSTSAGVALNQWTSNSGDNQQWQLIDTGAAVLEIQNKHSSDFVDGSQTALDQEAKGGGAAQLWQLVVSN